MSSCNGVWGASDGANQMESAREKAIADFTSTNLAGQKLYPYGTYFVKPELISAIPFCRRGDTGDGLGACYEVTLNFGYLDSLRTFGTAAYTNVHDVSQNYYAAEPWTDYTNNEGGQTTSNINYDFAFGDLSTAAAMPKSFTEIEMVVKVRTSINQLPWATPLAGGILDASKVLLGVTFPAGTLKFGGIQQNYIESQENVVGFVFTYRPVWAWLQDQYSNTGVAVSQRRFSSITFTNPTV